ncbi:MAG: biosynthetic-type acetolactate synthase large subunit, partial [Gammaproteobacteria bacterium]|nr:biosynthetic-type acetolactate synthase large subunit [Gammaproteobacteria bacterium]
MLSGAEMVIRSLQDEGVEYIYGYPGGSVLHIYDALFQQDKVKHVLVRHEQAATHMADAYARASGKPGVVFVTSGPGATNAVTGIATAYMDSIPMVVISGQVMSHLIGEDAFQETDILGVSRPVVKHNFAIKDAKDIPETIKKAFYVASTGRPGPVVVDIPKDMTAPTDKFEYSYPAQVEMRSYNPATRGHSGQIKKAMDMMVAARRPVILVGGGTIGGRASEVVIELAQKMNFPVSTTLMGLGGYPASDRQWLGMPGMHGSYEANMALHHADLILSLGARFDDRVTNATEKFCPTARIIHVDIDPSSISKTIAADVPIVGPAKSVVTEMLSLLAKAKGVPDKEALTDWWGQIDQWRQRHGGRYDTNADGLLKPQQVIEAVHKVTKGEAYVCSDVG